MSDNPAIVRQCLFDFYDYAALTREIQRLRHINLDLAAENRRLTEEAAEAEEEYGQMRGQLQYERLRSRVFEEDYERGRQAREWLEWELTDTITRLSRYETVPRVRRNLLPEFIDLTTDSDDEDSTMDDIIHDMMGN